MSLKTCLSLALAALIAAGCGNGGGQSAYKPKPAAEVATAKIEPGREAEIFPAEVGTQWVFASENVVGNQTTRGEVTFKVTDVQESADGKRVTIEVSAAEADPTRPGQYKPAVLNDRMVWLVGSDGIFMVSQSYRPAAEADLKAETFDPPVRMIPFPIKEGEKAEYKGSGPRMGTLPGAFSGTVRTVGIQEVDTDKGRMSALCAESTYSYESATKLKYETNVTSWWAPKVGIVRYVLTMTISQPNGQRAGVASTLRMKSTSK